MRYIINFIITIIILLIFSIPSLSQRNQPIKYRILGISVEGNNPKTGTESSAIISHSGLKINNEITLPGSEIRDAIEKLWALRIFSDIQILVENKIDDGIYLLIKVREYPRLEKIQIEGIDDLDEDDITKKISLINKQILTPDDINKAIRNIKSIYEEEGYFLATIEPEQIPAETTTTNSVILKLVIDEGPRVTIDNIEFEGNNAFDDGDLEGEFEDTKEKKWYHFILSSPKFEKQKYEDDKDRIIKFYRKNGYIDAGKSNTGWFFDRPV